MGNERKRDAENRVLAAALEWVVSRGTPNDILAAREMNASVRALRDGTYAK